eukprot:6983792-Prymnesium_polylepis.1
MAWQQPMHGWVGHRAPRLAMAEAARLVIAIDDETGKAAGGMSGCGGVDGGRENNSWDGLPYVGKVKREGPASAWCSAASFLALLGRGCHLRVDIFVIAPRSPACACTTERGARYYVFKNKREKMLRNTPFGGVYS